MQNKIYFVILLLLLSMILLVACATDAQEQSSSKSAGSPAMVDGVVVETINQHQYAVVNGFYPDPCTRISEVNQTVDGCRFVISLSTDSPFDMMCAQLLEAFVLSLLL